MLSLAPKLKILPPRNLPPVSCTSPSACTWPWTCWSTWECGGFKSGSPTRIGSSGPSTPPTSKTGETFWRTRRMVSPQCLTPPWPRRWTNELSRTVQGGPFGRWLAYVDFKISNVKLRFIMRLRSLYCDGTLNWMPT